MLLPGYTQLFFGDVFFSVSALSNGANDLIYCNLNIYLLMVPQTPFRVSDPWASSDFHHSRHLEWRPERQNSPLLATLY